MVQNEEDVVQDQINLVTSLMQKLPEQQRLVMQLKHWDGYSDEEIEQMTGLNRGNIKVILSRVRRMIREQFIIWEQR